MDEVLLSSCRRKTIKAMAVIVGKEGGDDMKTS